MSSYIKEITNDFCDKMGFERSVDCCGVVDNGEKQPQSILSKVKRQVYSGQLDFSLGKLNDLSRCALIVDSYGEVPKILHQLNKIYPELIGHISRHSTGYIGIHLNFVENNIPIEVQISTADAWLVKQASEHVYKRHRDFEAEIPVRLRLIHCENDQLVKNKMIHDFRKKFFEYKNDYNEINKLFKQLHETTDLYQNLPIIESMFLSYEINRDKFIKKHFDYDKILEQRLTNDAGLVDDLLVLNNSYNISPITKEIQKTLINNVGKIFERCISDEEDFHLNDVQKFIFELMNSYKNAISVELMKAGMMENENNFQNFIIKEINTSIVKTVLFLQDNISDFSEIDISDLFRTYKKELSLQGVVTPKKIVNNLTNMFVTDDGLNEILKGD